MCYHPSPLPIRSPLPQPTLYIVIISQFTLSVVAASLRPQPTIPELNWRRSSLTCYRQKFENDKTIASWVRVPEVSRWMRKVELQFTLYAHQACRPFYCPNTSVYFSKTFISDHLCLESTPIVIVRFYCIIKKSKTQHVLCDRLCFYEQNIRCSSVANWDQCLNLRPFLCL